MSQQPSRVAPFVRYPFTRDPWSRTLEILTFPFRAAVSLGPLWGFVGLLWGLLVAVVTVYAWLIVVLNVAYPLRPDNDDLSNAWGGPSMAGAWAVHGSVGLACLWAVPWLVRLFSNLNRGVWTRVRATRAEAQ